jgi:HK97 family phage major capsid protein
MPDPNEYTTEKEFMAACVPKRIEEGDKQDQAVAVCMSMWEKKSVTVTPAPEFTETEMKIGARNSRSDGERLQMIHDYAVENGATCEKEEPEDEEKSLDDTVINYGGEIKALGDGRVGGYLVRFSGPDDPDISAARDFFTPETDYMIEFPGKSIGWFNHALDAKKQRLINPVDVKDDEFGIWAETILDQRDRYEKFLYDLAQKGKLGWSSGTASHLVCREAVGQSHKVTRWPLGMDASLTHQPAEPRNEVIPLKSLGDNNAILPPLPPDPDPEGEIALEDHGDGGDPSTNSNILEVEMEPEELKVLMAEAAEAGARKALADLPAETKNIGNVSVPLDEADQPWANPGEFFKAVKTAAYYPSAEDPRLRSLKATGMSEGVPADGGYLIPPQTASGIIERMLDVGGILSRCAPGTTVGNSMTYNGVDETTHVGSLYGGLVGYWLSEAATKTASQPKWYQVELKLKKIAALCYATDEQLEDTAALQGWLMRTVPDVLRWYVESAIISGDGNGKPLGITQAPCLVSQLRLDANEVNPDDFANMWSRRWTGANDYVWLINPTVAAVMNMFAVGTFPVYMPAGSMVGVPHGTLYGRPVIETEHVPAFKSANDVILASLSNYQTLTKGGVQSATSIHVAFTTDETCFRFVYRIDGSPLWHSAVTPENGSTISPFVGLAAASS